MDLLPNKQYLSLNDIIDYLNKQGKEFNIENNYDRQKLYTLIIDYIRERSLNPLFYYNGNVKIELKKYHIFGTEPYEITKVEVNEFNKDINEYLKIIDNSIIDSLLIDNEAQSLGVSNKNQIDFYYLLPEMIDCDQHYVSINNPLSITSNDIRFPLTELNNIFNHFFVEKNDKRIEYKENPTYIDEQETIAKLQETIKTQAKEIEKLKNNLAELQIKAFKPNSIDTLAKTEKQGDSLLILGAVMACVGEVAKPNYTQQSLIDKIKSCYPNDKGLSESTLKKKFAESKIHLKQCTTN